MTRKEILAALAAAGIAIGVFMAFWKALFDVFDPRRWF